MEVPQGGVRRLPVSDTIFREKSNLRIMECSGLFFFLLHCWLMTWKLLTSSGNSQGFVMIMILHSRDVKANVWIQYCVQEATVALLQLLSEGRTRVLCKCPTVCRSFASLLSIRWQAELYNSMINRSFFLLKLRDVNLLLTFKILFIVISIWLQWTSSHDLVFNCHVKLIYTWILKQPQPLT